MRKARRRDRWIEWGSLLVCVLLIAVVSLSGVLNMPKTWPDVQLDYADGKKAWSGEAGDAYGVVASGPYVDLPAGVYRIKWQMDADGDNIIRLTSTNDACIEPAVIHTAAGVWEDEAVFELKDPAHNFAFHLEFASGSKLAAHNFRLYSPEYTDQTWTFSFMLLGVWALFVLIRRGKITPERKQTLAILGAAVLFACLPSLQADRVFSWDVQFHAARFMNIADGLRAGQLPVRVGGFSYNGYGAATSVFYPDVLLYPLALMLLCGASITYVMHVYSIAVTALTAAVMYGAAKRILNSRGSAVCAAVLYVLSLYRLGDVYERFMVGEMLAMAVLPLFLLGLYEVFFGEKSRWPLLALGATLVFQSHLVSTLLCALIAAGSCLIFFRRLIAEKGRLAAVVKTCAATLLINLGTLVPFAMYYFGGLNTPVVQFGFVDQSLSVYELFSSMGCVGAALWIAVAALACAAENTAERKRAVWFAAAGAALALMTTRAFPWNYVVAATGGLVEIIQFPNRLMTWSTLLLAMAGGYGLWHALSGRGALAMILTLALAVFSSAPYMEYTLAKETGIEFGHGANPYMVYPEYQFQGTDVHDTRSRQPILTGDVELTQYHKDGTHVTAQVAAQEGGEICLPMFGFDGYAAELGGERVYWRRGENNRLTVDVPAGTTGELRVWFAGNALWKIADGISLFSVAALAFYVFRRRKGESVPNQKKER